MSKDGCYRHQGGCCRHQNGCYRHQDGCCRIRKVATVIRKVATVIRTVATFIGAVAIFIGIMKNDPVLTGEKFVQPFNFILFLIQIIGVQFQIFLNGKMGACPRNDDADKKYHDK